MLRVGKASYHMSDFRSVAAVVEPVDLPTLVAERRSE
jgi:hypothetical protein